MTKIGDRFIVDISKISTFSGMFVWSLPEPSVSVFTILNCREPSLSVLHDRINNPLAFFTTSTFKTIRWRYFTILGLKNHSVVLFKRYRTQKVPSGTTMRRACELVVPLGTFCVREWRLREIGMEELKKLWFRSLPFVRINSFLVSYYILPLFVRPDVFCTDRVDNSCTVI